MRILVVDDEEDLLSSIKVALADEGYDVDTAIDGEEGASKAEAADYDVVVLDIMLPRLDGWQALARIRKTKKTPVLMLTARDATLDRVKGLDGGADDYLIKPFDLGEFLARLRALIRRNALHGPARLEAGDVSVDTAARIVRQRGASVILTAREYALVEYLVQRKGQVVTRTDLYEYLFDEDDNTLSNLLDVHVSNVRRKLGHDFVTTLKGHGYCVER